MVGIGDRDLVAGARAGSPPCRAAAALAAATDMIVPVLADVAITSIRRLIQPGHRGLPVVSVLRRRLVSAPRELSRPNRIP